jgi:hypothetical protein
MLATVVVEVLVVHFAPLAMAAQLCDQGLKVWFDKWALPAGGDIYLFLPVRRSASTAQ